MAESENRPWLRKIRVTLGPLAEWQNKTSGSTVQFLSDGTMSGLRVTANIQKTLMGLPSPSTVKVYNLSSDTRNAVKKGLTKLTLEAGWNNTDLATIFKGSVMNVQSERSGADVVTSFLVLPGFGALAMGASSATFGPGTSVAAAAEQLGKDLPGIAVNKDSFQGVEGNIGGKGWSYAGTTKDGLTRLSEEYGFSWSIQEGSLKCIGDKFMLGSSVELNGKNGGLINISPVLSGPLQWVTGVKIKALYVPGITVGSSVKVTSDLNKSLSGTYRVHTISIDIDAYSSTWTMDIESYKLGVKVK